MANHERLRVDEKVSGCFQLRLSPVELFPPRGGLGWREIFVIVLVVYYFRGGNIHLENMENLYENPGMAWDGVDEVGLLEKISWSEKVISLHLVDAVSWRAVT